MAVRHADGDAPLATAAGVGLGGEEDGVEAARSVAAALGPQGGRRCVATTQIVLFNIADIFKPTTLLVP